MATVYYYSQATGANNGGEGNDAYQDLQTALDSLSAGDHLYCKRHSSREGVKTTNLTLATNSQGTDGNTTVEGYTTTPGDGGMYQTSSPIKFLGDGITIKYMDVDLDNDGDKAILLQSDGGLAYRCKAVNTYPFGNAMEVQDASAIECYVKGVVNQSGNYVLRSNRGLIINCIVVISSASGANGCGMSVTVNFRQNMIVGNIVINEDGAENHVGMLLNGNSANGALVSNNTIYNMDVGIEHTDGMKSDLKIPNVYYGNILYSVGTGILNSRGSNTVDTGQLSVSNAFGAVTTAQTTNMASVVDSITLTESPFIDTTDFKLNDASGGGALLKGKLGRPNPLDLASTTRTQFQSFGAMQPAAASSSTLPTIVSFF